MLSPTAAGVRVPGSPEEVRSAGETNMSREENKSKFGGRLGYILNDSTALPRVTFSNGLIRALPASSAGILSELATFSSLLGCTVHGSQEKPHPRRGARFVVAVFIARWIRFLETSPPHLR